MNTLYIPGVQDANLIMENAITKTATFNGTSLDNGAGFAPSGGGMPVNVVVDITAMDEVSGDETYTFVVQESDDNATFTDCGPSVALTAAATSAVRAYAIPGILSKRYCRLKLTIGGTTPSITYSAWLNPQGFAAAR